MGALMAITVTPIAGCGGGEDALSRGDRLWADSLYAQSTAEYQLAYARGGGDDALRRLAHAYAVTGQFERAREAYQTLLADDPSHADQAVFDFILLAERARDRDDGYGVARAAEAALALRPALDLTGLTDELAEYYEQTASADQAIAWYERALATASPDSAPGLLFRIGRLLADRDDCARALPYLRAYLGRAPRGPRASDARWNIGNCAYAAARTAHQSGDPERALQQAQVVIDLGVPENLLDEAWFLRGEIFYSLGRNEEAMAAYQRVLDLNPTRTGQLVDRAQRQIDIIRFGGNR
jgi:tetratricopeptide (TPR) repeat protein